MHREPQPVKLYTIGPMYRYAAPQRGRYREHWQLSVEAIGSDHPSVDAEIIQLYHALLVAVGCDRVHARAELDRVSRMQARLPRAPGRVARCESRSPRRTDEREGLHQPAARVRQLRRQARGRSRRRSTKRRRSGSRSARPARSTSRPFAGTSTRAASPYEIVPTLVRGLDYYTRTTWEFLGPDEGAQSALSGGGRYDGLVEEIGGPPIPGVGFGAGIERLVLAVEHAGREAATPVTDIFFAAEDGASRALIATWLGTLRARGIASDTDYAGRSLKGQLTQADARRGRDGRPGSSRRRHGSQARTDRRGASRSTTSSPG